MLIINKKLQHLSIDGNQFSDDGVKCVAEGLRHNDVLTELRLHDCKITVKGMDKRSDCMLHCYIIYYPVNTVTEESLAGGKFDEFIFQKKVLV